MDLKNPKICVATTVHYPLDTRIYFKQVRSLSERFAVDYYAKVLGPPAYAEGTGTRGWQIGAGWLTLLRGSRGNPTNVEITFDMETPTQAEKLQQAFIDAGGKGTPPSNQLMYVPIRACPIVDPFGTEILVISRLS